ncbi:MAG: hypothetical protein HQ559_12550 [Lentisphaerae bacterium]|nr:hypothetical protein [Lentisphaerota bacterium]
MGKELYAHFIKRRPDRRLMWHGMVEELGKSQCNKPCSELLDHLDMIRKNFRNPTQHPEKIYDIDEAQDLFGNCISALHMIIKEIDGSR